MRGKIEGILRDLGLEIYGFCRFSDVGELLNTRNKIDIPQNAATVITFLFPYRIPINEKRNVSLYAVGLDYHDIILKKLDAAKERLSAEFPNNNFAAFSDNSPIRETRAAYLSGLGFLGQNSLIIHPKYGSYCFIGEIVCDLEIERYSKPLGYCEMCGKCLEKCVGGALCVENGEVVFTKENCLSFLTQKKGELTDTQKEKIKKGGLVWGCDVCSDVCPMNSGADYSNIEDFYASAMPYLDENNLSLSSDRAYGYKGEKILLRNLGILSQNGGNNN